jgi:hypothetical protein
MKYTLLEIVQEILNDMDSDEVNSISDTTESLQVANIVKETYFHLTSQMDLPEQTGLFNLNASGDNTQPVLMYAPSNVLKTYWIKYDSKGNGETESKFVSVQYLDLNDFLDRTLLLNTADTYVGSMTYSINSLDFEFKYLNDRSPTYYTVLQDNTLIFDSYDSSVDTTLQKSKTYCYGLLEPEFTLDDSFTPLLDSTEFNWFVNECKLAASVKLRQAVDPIAQSRARKGLIRSQRQKENHPSNVSYYSRHNGFGRK